LLKFHGGISWQEHYDMPVAYKHWYLDRLRRELDKGDTSQDTAQGSQTPQRNINLRRLQSMLSESKQGVGGE
jgi:hypothetical protein